MMTSFKSIPLLLLAGVVLSASGRPLSFSAADELQALEIKSQIEIEGHNKPLVRRQASNNNNQGGLNPTTVIAVSVVLVGGYFLLLFLLAITLIFCFVRFNCQCAGEKCTCNPKCSKKPRLRCSKTVEDNVCYCCSRAFKICCPCCSNVDEWDSGELGFWIEIVILGILCFPFALCCVILWALATSR